MTQQQSGCYPGVGLSLPGLTRWNPRWSDLSLGGRNYVISPFGERTGMVSFMDTETLQTVDRWVRLHVPGSRGMEGAMI